jgi:putative transposase
VPAEFQRIMDQVFSGLEFVKCYIDDIIVFSTSPQKHRTQLADVFVRLRLHGLKLHLRKCKFYFDRIEYLGYMIYL